MKCNVLLSLNHLSMKPGLLHSVPFSFSSIFAAQRGLKVLAPEFNWAGLGNLPGDFGELVAIEHYGLTKGPRGADGYDERTAEGQTVQIKTNYAASQIGFRGDADLMLVIGVKDDGNWDELYYSAFQAVKSQSRYSERDNKHMIAISKLRQIKK